VTDPYWSDGKRTIYHGDCREILPTLGKFDLLLTDPPYGIGFAAMPTKWQRLSGQLPDSWDDSPPDCETIGICVERAVESVIWGGNYFRLGSARCLLSWVKPDSPPSMGSVEYAWTSFNCNSRHMIHSISSTNKERVGHPTQKPVALMRWCISFAPNAKTILDPFMGSGTTLLAAKLEGLEAVGIELLEKYCEAAVKRLQQNTLDFIGQ